VENDKEENGPPLGDLRERIAKLETNMKWVISTLKSVDKRQWWILGSVVVLGCIAILIAVLKR